MTDSSVSVVIPTHNRAMMIESAISSALCQTWSPAEVIVVDDASDDETPDVVQRVTDSRLRLIRLDRNVGGAAARNIGIAAARSDFVAFLDSDDWWLPNKLELQLQRLRDSDAQVVYSLSYSARQNLAVKQRGASPEGNVLGHLAGGWCPPTTSSFMISRSVFLRAGFDEGLLGLQDYDLWMQLALTGFPFVLVDAPLTVFVQHGGPRVSTSMTNRLAALEEVHKKWSSQLVARGLGDRFDDAIERWKWLTKFAAYINSERPNMSPSRGHLLKTLAHVSFDRSASRRFASYLLLGRRFYKARSQRFLTTNGIDVRSLRPHPPPGGQWGHAVDS